MADATAKTSGYAASESTVGWTGATYGINYGLTDNMHTDLSDEVDNSTNKYLLMDWEIVLDSVSFSGADAAIELFVVRTLDGTNYPPWPGGSTADEPETWRYLVDAGLTTGAAGAQRLIGGPILVPPGKFKFAIRNRGNVTLATSGNTLKYRPHGFLSDE